MKKIISIILILSTLLLVITGCAAPENTPVGDDTTSAASEETAQEETTELVYTPDFEVTDWEGREFIFACTSENYDGGYYETIDIYVESEIGEVFNDAVYRRNKNVEEKYNVVIVENKYDSVRTTIANAVSAGDDICNAVFSLSGEPLFHAQSGMLIDLNTMPYMDFDQPWWDANAKAELSIGGKSYLMTGDISVMDDNCTMLFFFNKKLISDYDLANPYELLHSDKWTFDEYQSMVKGVSADLNGDGAYDDNDLFGTVLAYHYVQYIAQAGGMKYTENDGNGIPQPTFMNDHTVNVIDKISGLFFDETAAVFYDNLKDPGGGNSYTYGRRLFTKDQILFCLSQPLIFYEFRDMESEFGIMPIPKYDESQSRYYSAVDIACTFLTVPKTIADRDFTGYILEAFAAESKNALTPAYYDVMLKRKYTRDDESAEVLDLISKSRLYDLGVFFGWGGVNNIISTAIKSKNTDIQSAYDKIAESFTTAITKTVEAFTASELS